MLHENFDWRVPDYAKAFRQRIEYLARIRDRPDCLPDLKAYYRENPADFISDFGITFDPRNAERGLPSYVPFILFPKQREWVEWTIKHWRAGTPGITQKSRDCGLSWLAMALSCTLCLFYDGVAVGVGSRKTEYVDKIGAIKPLLPKARIFMEYLPEEFRGGWLAWRDAPFMRITFPESNSIIGGEGGDDLGRGDRTSLFLVDEFAYFERPELTEMSLSQTTNCRIDISSVNGMNNPFARKVHEGKIDVFRFSWRDDPRKDDEWYRLLSASESEGGKGLDPVTIAQEVDCDYLASVEGVAIPGAWVRSAIDAHVKLGYPEPSGVRGMSLDIADEGVDKNAACVSKGVLVEWAEAWSGKGGDIFQTVERAFSICEERGIWEFDYDADGLGAGVRGDARIINQRRAHAKQRAVAAMAFRGSEAVINPDKIVEGTLGREGDKGRTNKDMFANRKAQGWWALRRRFQLTHRWIAEGIACRPDDIVSISSKFPACMALVAELSQATYETNGVGKIVINKTPDGMKSPNCFVAGTLVATPRGEVPIESIVDGDEVETPFGRSKVIRTWVSETDVLTSASFSSGAVLTGTPDHKVFVWGKGKVRLDDLVIFCRIEPYRKRRLLWGLVSSFYMRAKNSGFTTLVDITARATRPRPSAFFIVACGLTATALSRKIITSITRTAIGATTTSPTWSVSWAGSTARCTWSSDWRSRAEWREMPKTWRRRASLRQNGTDLQRAERGMWSTGSTLTTIGYLIWRSASNAVQSFRHSAGSSAAINAGSGLQPDGGQPSKRNAFGAAIRSLFAKGRPRTVAVSDVRRFSAPGTSVYNLTLEEDNAYYANGILVFNCADAMMMRFAPKGPRPVLHTMDMVRQIQRAGRRPMG